MGDHAAPRSRSPESRVRPTVRKHKQRKGLTNDARVVTLPNWWARRLGADVAGVWRGSPMVADFVVQMSPTGCRERVLIGNHAAATCRPGISVGRDSSGRILQPGTTRGWNDLGVGCEHQRPIGTRHEHATTIACPDRHGFGLVVHQRWRFTFIGVEDERHSLGLGPQYFWSTR